MQEFVDSSDDGRRNKDEMEELAGLARWRRGCLCTSRAIGETIFLVTSNGLRHLTVLLLPVRFPRQSCRVPLLNFVASRVNATFFSMLTLYGVKVNTDGIS
jgi:hypothetical protein